VRLAVLPGYEPKQPAKDKALEIELMEASARYPVLVIGASR